MAGDFLPPQLIYKGKTKKCLPAVTFPSDWHITYHWSNEDTMVDYLIEKILFPYAEKKETISSLSLLNQFLLFLIDFEDSAQSVYCIFYWSIIFL